METLNKHFRNTFETLNNENAQIRGVYKQLRDLSRVERPATDDHDRRAQCLL